MNGEYLRQASLWRAHGWLMHARTARLAGRRVSAAAYLDMAARCRRTAAML